jgi:hypothetical protein
VSTVLGDLEAADGQRCHGVQELFVGDVAVEADPVAVQCGGEHHAEHHPYGGRQVEAGELAFPGFGGEDFLANREYLIERVVDLG